MVAVNGNVFASSSGIYNLDEWTHVAGVITAAGFEIYVNGVKDTGAGFTTGGA